MLFTELEYLVKPAILIVRLAVACALAVLPCLPATALAQPTCPTALTTTHTEQGERYFRVELQLGIPDGLRNPPNPVTLIWDASAAGAHRDHVREFTLLDAWFKSLGNVKVHLIEARETAAQHRTFEVGQGNWDTLRGALETIKYHGANNPATWRTSVPLPRGFTREELAGFQNLTLVVTDGLAGINSLPPDYGTGSYTTYTVSALAGANMPGLRALSEPTGGKSIDLMEMPVAQAVQALLNGHARLSSMHAKGADQLRSLSPWGAGGLLVIAGRMTQDTARLTLYIETPQRKRVQQTLEIKASEPGSKLLATFDSNSTDCAR